MNDSNFKFLHINKKKVILPKINKSLDMEYISHPGAVMIIPFLSDTEIILISLKH